MRAWFILCFLPLLCEAQLVKAVRQPSDIDYLSTFRAFTQVATSNNKNTQNLEDFLVKLEAKQNLLHNQKHFLQQMFRKTHKVFLKRFQPYTSFNDLLNSGHYNCLTATALYGLMLERLHFNYSIIETNYHIFILVNLGEGGKILIESTDPVEGFVTNESEIERKLASYRTGSTELTAQRKKYFLYNFELYNEVTLPQLAGLMHYNEAVLAYNNGRLALAINELDKAMQIYMSPRLEEFSKIVLLSVVQSNLNNSAKENFVRKLQSLKKRSRQAFASNNL